MRTLAGVGPFGHPNLANINDDSGTIDMDRLTSGVDFLEGCLIYYHTPFDVRWDRDNNGSFETAGAAIDFDATAIDGPASFSIPVRAAHAASAATAQHHGGRLGSQRRARDRRLPGEEQRGTAHRHRRAVRARPDTADGHRVVHRSRQGRSPDGTGELG